MDCQKLFESTCELIAKIISCNQCNLYNNCDTNKEKCVEKIREYLLKELIK